MLILIEVVKCVSSWTLTYISIKAVLNKNKQKPPDMTVILKGVGVQG